MGAAPRVVIVGGGFGGLCAALALRGAPVEVTLVDRRNFHLFQPLLYQVATGSLSPGEIAAPLRGVLARQKHTRVLLDEARDVDPASREVVLAGGARLAYDSLIVAAGSRSNYFGNDAWREWAPSLKSVEEATEIRHKILYAFEVAEWLEDPAQRRAWLTFVIVGAGATGVELAGAIAEIARHTLRHDFRSIRPAEARIILMDGGVRVLPAFSSVLAEKATASLSRLGVEVQTGRLVKDVDKDGLTIEHQGVTSRLEARTVIWAGGVRVSEFGKTIAERTRAETDKSGRIKVGADLTIPGYPDIYVVGDLAFSLDSKGEPLIGVAQVAMQQGTYSAKVISRRAQGKPPLPPFAYFDKGNLAVIGRWSAVANVFGLPVWGLPAWIVWAFIHLMYLVQFQSRVIVFTKWALQDLTFNRGSRLITGRSATDFDLYEDYERGAAAKQTAARPELLAR